MNKIVIILMSALLYLFSATSWGSCAFNNMPGYITSTKSLTMPISGTISVPPDTPVGTEIYRLKILLSNAGGVGITCTSAGQFYYSYKYLTTPLLPPTYSSTVYNTGLPGIGVKYVRGNNLADFPTTVATGCNTTSCIMATGWTIDSRLIFIKTASTVSPGLIEASKLPSVVYSFGQNGQMVDVYQMTLTGSLRITTPTCEISPASQSMAVNMGNYHTSEFAGKGSVTEWKNASIQLINCDQFYGNIPSGYTGGTFNGTTTSSNSKVNNFLSVALLPRNGTPGASDAANGIMNIDDETHSATGVGIQLSSSENASGIINLTTGITQSLSQVSTPKITIPLYARYIQTENNVTAGKANGRLEYIITYQ